MSQQQNNAIHAKFNYPCGIKCTSSGHIIIADKYNHRIRVLADDGKIMTIAGNGKEGYGGDGDLAINALLNYPSGIAITQTGEILIADTGNNRIRKVSNDGIITTVAGNGDMGWCGDHGLAIHAELNNPVGIAVTRFNEIVIADTGNNLIRKVFSDGTIKTIAGILPGECRGDGPATSCKLIEPIDVLVDNHDNIYISEFGSNRISVLSRDELFGFIQNTKLGWSYKEDTANNADMSEPFGIAFTQSDELILADFFNDRIRKASLDHKISTVAGNRIRGYSGDEGPAIDAQLNRPSGVTVDLNGEILVTDTHNHRIRKILLDGTIITIAGDGTKGYSGDSDFDRGIYSLMAINYPKKQRILLKKQPGDRLFDSEIYAFIPLVQKLSPQFANILQDEKLICSLDQSQQTIVQRLIDSLIYTEDQPVFSNTEIVDLLFVLGFFENREFINLKKRVASEFVKSTSLTNIINRWERIRYLLDVCDKVRLRNYILDQLDNFCIESVAMHLHSKEGNDTLSKNPIISNNIHVILPKLYRTENSRIVITNSEVNRIIPDTIESLYDDGKTSDIKIKIGDNQYIHCHRTILASSSTLFWGLLNSNASFTDFFDGIFIPDPSDDLELLLIVIKSLYNLKIDHFELPKDIRLLDMALKYESEPLIDLCAAKLALTVDNYFNIVESCEKYLHLPAFERFLKKIIAFTIHNRKRLFQNEENVSNLHIDIMKGVIIAISK